MVITAISLIETTALSIEQQRFIWVDTAFLISHIHKFRHLNYLEDHTFEASSINSSF